MCVRLGGWVAGAARVWEARVLVSMHCAAAPRKAHTAACTIFLKYPHMCYCNIYDEFMKRFMYYLYSSTVYS